MRLVEAIRTVPKRTSALLAIATAVVVVPAALLAWGPDRPTYTTAKPADHVTFNSITDNPEVGDERNFVRVKESTAPNSAYSDSVSLQAGKEYTVYMYYHNNAASSLNASGKGIAKDVSAKAQIPAVVPNQSNGTAMEGYISASNATPKSVYDEARFANKTGGDIALRFVPGSAAIHNGGKSNGAKLSDNIVTTGAALGYDSLNGVVPGCNNFAGYVTFKVKADQPNFEVIKQVRKTGEKTWQKSVAANAGDSVDYMITYKNTGTTMQNNVVVKDTLPQGISYTAGTAMLANPKNPNGVAASDGVITTGLNVGNYAPISNAYVKFSAKVAAKDKLPCGPQTLVNKATVSTNNGSKSDTANVTVTGNVCKPEEKMVSVCEIATGKIISVKESEQSNPKYAPANSDKCKPAVKKIEVCDLKTQKIVTINEKDFDSKKHSKNFSDCKMTKVCDTTTGKIITVKESQKDNENYGPVDSGECVETPETPKTPGTPSELPKTGAADVLAQVTGLFALVASSAYYVTSRRQA